MRHCQAMRLFPCGFSLAAVALFCMQSRAYEYREMSPRLLQNSHESIQCRCMPVQVYGSPVSTVNVSSAHLKSLKIVAN